MGAGMAWDQNTTVLRAERGSVRWWLCSLAAIGVSAISACGDDPHDAIAEQRVAHDASLDDGGRRVRTSAVQRMDTSVVTAGAGSDRGSPSGGAGSSAVVDAAFPDASAPHERAAPDAMVGAATSSDASGVLADASLPGPALLDAAAPDAGRTNPPPDAAACEPWAATVEPDGLRCTQEPPSDVGPFGGRVALTFDDGPNPATTPQILAILREQQIPATFFIVGRMLEQPAARAIAREIHEDRLFRVANHSYSHARMIELSPAEVVLQVERTTAAIQLAVGHPCFYPAFFRHPYTHANCATIEIVRARGHAVVGMHIDTLDWCYAQGGRCDADRVDEQYREDMVGFTLSQLQRFQGGIVLLHDIHPSTVAMLPALIAALRDEGATFVQLDDSAVFPQLNAEIETPIPPACCADLAL
jgi:peptidoglycan-N-acetylglucosamine deacetylase